MPDDHEYFRNLVDSRQIRTSARAIIFSPDKELVLVEKNLGTEDQYHNFIGGGVELGETFEAAMRREITEETDANVIRIEYLFVLENFIDYKGDLTHSIEHYFELELDRQEVLPANNGIEFVWLPVDELAGVDLRPHAVRDLIVEGPFRSTRHLVSRDVRS
ncbi:MAG: NUDIX domain-containing protein [Anaerolineales bacterium]|nr:NUDIX domain-containing protein [Anaerolineales bacterium]